MSQRLTTIEVKTAEKGDGPDLSQLMANIEDFERRHRSKRRATVYRLLLVAAFLPTAGLAVVGLHREPTAAQAPPPRLPRDFNLVEERYDEVRLLDTRSQVEELFGPPTQRAVWEPDFPQLMKQVEHSNRHIGVPADRIWFRWAGSRDEGKSVTILFARDRVYYKFKRGF